MIERIPTLPRMSRLAVEYVFNKKNMPDSLKRELLEGIEKWNRRKSTPQDQRKAFERIMAAIVQDSKGGFNAVKENIARHGLDYRIMYREGF